MSRVCVRVVNDETMMKTCEKEVTLTDDYHERFMDEDQLREVT